MEECAKRVPRDAAPEIVNAHAGAHEPALARIGEREQVARQRRGSGSAVIADLAESAATRSCRIACSVSSLVCARNGGRPASNSYSTIPKLNTSLR
jgi:hypothetical protein